MATFAEIEDLRDWFEDMCGEFMGKIDALNGEEPEVITAKIKICAQAMHDSGLDLIKWLEALLVAKKRAEA